MRRLSSYARWGLWGLLVATALPLLAVGAIVFFSGILLVELLEKLEAPARTVAKEVR